MFEQNKFGLKLFLHVLLYLSQETFNETVLVLGLRKVVSDTYTTFRRYKDIPILVQDFRVLPKKQRHLFVSSSDASISQTEGDTVSILKGDFWGEITILFEAYHIFFNPEWIDLHTINWPRVKSKIKMTYLTLLKIKRWQAVSTRKKSPWL